MEIRIDTKYEVWNMTKVKLPSGKTLDDIKDVSMKWGEGSIEFKDGTTLEDYFKEDEIHHEEFKRPKELTFEEV